MVWYGSIFLLLFVLFCSLDEPRPIYLLAGGLFTSSPYRGCDIALARMNTFRYQMSRCLRLAVKGKLPAKYEVGISHDVLARSPSWIAWSHHRLYASTTFSLKDDPKPSLVHVSIDEARQTTAKALQNLGWDEADAALQAEIMIAAELCGNNQGT